jgi:hypothetical protein
MGATSSAHPSASADWPGGVGLPIAWLRWHLEEESGNGDGALLCVSVRAVGRDECTAAFVGTVGAPGSATGVLAPGTYIARVAELCAPRNPPRSGRLRIAFA